MPSGYKPIRSCVSLSKYQIVVYTIWMSWVSSFSLSLFVGTEVNYFFSSAPSSLNFLILLSVVLAVMAAGVLEFI